VTILGQSKDTYRLAPCQTSYAIILKIENYFRVKLLGCQDLDILVKSYPFLKYKSIARGALLLNIYP